MFRRNALALVLVFLSPVVSAAVTSDWMSISTINTGWDKNRTVLTMTDVVPDPMACQDPVLGGKIVTTEDDQINLDLITSVALSAFMGGKEVQLVVSTIECATGSTPRPRLMSIKMR